MQLSFTCSFPLFSKGKERFQFNYGVYLLNKNIAQVLLLDTLPIIYRILPNKGAGRIRKLMSDSVMKKQTL